MTTDVRGRVLSEGQIDSLRAIFNEMLADEALADRMRVCVLAAYGQLLVSVKYFSEAFPYIKQANDMAVRILPIEDIIRGYAQAGYGCYLDFYHARELALAPLAESLQSLGHFHPEKRRLGQAIFRILMKNKIYLGLLDEAHRDYEQRLTFLANEKDTSGLAWTHNNFGLFLQRAGHHSEAIGVLDRGLATFSHLDSEEYRNAYINLQETKSHSLVAVGKLEEALSLLKQAYFARKQMNRHDGAMQSLNYIISYLMDVGKYQEAYRLFTNERPYVELYDNLTHRSFKLYQNAAELMDIMGFHSGAKSFRNAYHAFAADRLLPIAEAKSQTPKELSEQILLQNRAYEQDILIAQLETDQLRKELKARQYGMVALGLFVVVLSLFGFGWWWRRRRTEQERKRAEADQRRILELENENLKYSVAHQEKDIKRLAAENRLRAKLKRDLLQRIDQISSLASKDKEAQLDKLKRELASTVNNQESISELQNRVETINAAFEDNLRAKVPGITAQEVRYCSLVRLGMDNQQIAQLLNKSDATIRTYKHRINKKAGLEGKDALRALVERL